MATDAHIARPGHPSGDGGGVSTLTGFDSLAPQVTAYHHPDSVTKQPVCWIPGVGTPAHHAARALAASGAVSKVQVMPLGIDDSGANPKINGGRLRTTVGRGLPSR
jgi:hypothetical protein